jgi:AraC-like DNA-binding protein
MGKVVKLETATRAIRTYSMLERATHLDFEIRREGVRPGLDLPHRHEYFQIQINLAGDTSQHIGATVRPFAAGMLSFVLPYRVHWVPHPPGSRYYIISFGQRFLRPDLDTDPLDLEDVPLDRAPELAPFILQDVIDFPLEGDEWREMQRLCERMLEEHGRRGFYSMELIRAHLLLLIGLVCRRHQGAIAGKAMEQTARHGRREALARVMRHVREHLAERLSLEDAAAAAFLSPNYLAHLIKKETGRTFIELVTERRMERAQELLVNTDMRVSEVAQASGFADEAYFSRRFRKLAGTSPVAFRAAARNRSAFGHIRPSQ